MDSLVSWMRAFLRMLLLCAVPVASLAVSPGRFQADATALVFDSPNNVTEDGSQTNYPTFCVDPTGSGHESVLTAEDVGPLWRTVGFDATTGKFTLQAGADFPLDAGITAAQSRLRLVAPIDATGRPKVFVQMIRGSPQGLDTLGIFDLQTSKLEGVALTVEGLPVAARDLDGDGIPEVLLLAGPGSGSATLTVMDARLTHVLSSTHLSAGATSGAYAFGKFNSASPNQIVTGSGSVYTLTTGGATLIGSIPATVNGATISFLKAADVDGDGLDEIIALYGNTLRVYDFDTQQVKWENSPSLNPAAQLVALQVADLTGNGRPAILLGQLGSPPAATGYIFVYDGTTGVELKAIAHTYAGVYGLTACDFAGTHVRDIVVQTDNPFQGPDDMYVYDSQTGNLKGHSIEEFGPIRGILLADVEGTGSPEVVWQPDGLFGVGDLAIHARDASTFQVRWDTPSPFLPVLGTGRMAALASGNVMGDGQAYLVTGSSQNGQGIIWIVDPRTRAIVRTVTLDANDVVMSLAVADVDANGHPRILAGVDGPNSPRLEVIDGAMGARLWHVGLPSPSGVAKIKAADMNNDGHDDIVVQVGTDYQGGAEFYIVDGSTHNATAVATTLLSAFEIIDINGDAIPELALAHADGSIDVLDVGSGTILHHYQACATDSFIEEPMAIAVDKLSSASPGDVLYTCGSHVAWMSLTSGASEVITGVIANQVGFGNNLLSFGADAASDRIIVGSFAGVTHLAPVSALAPYVDPGNQTSTNVFGGHWSQPYSNAITFGTFDGTPASLELVSSPAHGTITLDGSSGAFTYTGATPFKGTEYFVVRARTASATSAPTTVPLVLRNAPPTLIATEASVTVQAGSSTSVILTPMDSDLDTVILLVVQPPTQGTLAFNGGVVVYTANAGSSGMDIFAVEAFDQLDYSAPMVVTVNIQAPASTPPPNTPPPPPPPASSSGGGGSLDTAFVLALLVMLGARRRCD